jgi:hypothetical protein
MKMPRNGDLTTWPEFANEPRREKGGGRRARVPLVLSAEGCAAKLHNELPSLTDSVAEMNAERRGGRSDAEHRARELQLPLNRDPGVVELASVPPLHCFKTY